MPEYEIGYQIPKGGIILWSGSIANIPNGWVLCDGNSGTPNLQDKFIVGAGSTYAVDGTGGNINHNHSFSSVHTHTIGGNTGASNHTLSTLTSGLVSTYTYGMTSSHTHTLPANSGNGTASGDTGNNSIIPVPYYALAYIMKL